MKLHFDIYGDEQIQRELLRFANYTGNAGPALQQIADDMREQIADQFATEGERGSGGWAPLQESTIAAKAAAGLDPHILQATGALMESLTGRGGDNIEEVSDDHLVLGSRVAYGKFHQKGTSKMPARKPVEFSELDRRGFVRTLQRFLVEGTLR